MSHTVDSLITDAESGLRNREVEVTIRRRGKTWEARVVLRTATGVEVANRVANASTFSGLEPALSNLLRTMP